MAGRLRSAKAPSTISSLMIREKIFVFMFYLQNDIDNIIKSDNVNFILQLDRKCCFKQIMRDCYIRLNALVHSFMIFRGVDPDNLRIILLIVNGG